MGRSIVKEFKGADKVGSKTAAYLLERFGTLENILENAKKIERPSIKDSIIRNTDRLRRNYKIIKLGNSTPLPFALDCFAYRFAGLSTANVLKGIGLY